MAIVFNYATALLCVCTLIGAEPTLSVTVDEGIVVSLASYCPANETHERDNFVVSFSRDRTIWFNNHQVDERTLRNEVAYEMHRRQARIVWIAADDGVSYGEVAETISKMTKDTPDLRTVMTTQSQTGPVDPAGKYHDTTGRPDRFFASIDELCIAPIAR